MGAMAKSKDELTREELEAIADEVGLSPTAVRVALTAPRDKRVGWMERTAGPASCVLGRSVAYDRETVRRAIDASLSTRGFRVDKQEGTRVIYRPRWNPSSVLRYAFDVKGTYLPTHVREVVVDLEDEGAGTTSVVLHFDLGEAQRIDVVTGLFFPFAIPLLAVCALSCAQLLPILPVWLLLWLAANKSRLHLRAQRRRVGGEIEDALDLLEAPKLPG